MDQQQQINVRKCYKNENFNSINLARPILLQTALMHIVTVIKHL